MVEYSMKSFCTHISEETLLHLLTERFRKDSYFVNNVEKYLLKFVHIRSHNIFAIAILTMEQIFFLLPSHLYMCPCNVAFLHILCMSICE